MKCNKPIMNLNMFGSDKDFFVSAFEESNKVSTPEEVPSDDVVDAPTDNTEVVEETEEIPETQEVVEPPKLSKEEIEALYKEHFGEIETPVVDEATQSALELYKYLESNPHLVQAMREVDVEGYQHLNNFVPDEVTRELNELKGYVEEQRYKEYISDLKSKYNDFDEDKVLEYAEQHDTVDLELAYKAMSADSKKAPNVDEMKEQIRREIMEELKNNSINTQSIIGGVSQKPIVQDKVTLNNRESRIASAMGLTAEEYAKWR